MSGSEIGARWYHRVSESVKKPARIDTPILRCYIAIASWELRATPRSDVPGIHCKEVPHSDPDPGGRARRVRAPSPADRPGVPRRRARAHSRLGTDGAGRPSGPRHLLGALLGDHGRAL